MSKQKQKSFRPGYDVEHFGSLHPIIIQTALMEILKMREVSNGVSELIFNDKDKALKIVLNCAFLANVYDISPDGYADVKKTGKRMCSPVGVCKLALSLRDLDGLACRVVWSIISDIEDDCYIACIDNLLPVLTFILDELPKPTVPVETV